MPRVSDAYRAEQRARILAAAESEFTRNGFRATSMDDIVRAAGMSAGGVYRYFSGKEEIVTALAAEVSDQMAMAVAQVLADPAVDLAEAIHRLVALVHARADTVGRMAVTIMGEAQRDPGVAVVAARQQERLRAQLVPLVEASIRAGDLPAPGDGDTQAVVAAVFSLLVGYLLQCRIAPTVSPEVYAAVVCRTLGLVRAGRTTR